MSEPPNLVLTGFMGTGKTTVGQQIARKTGLPLVDSDALITARAGMTVPEIFRQHGEAEFRRLEREVCAEVAARRGQIIATGGGMLVNPDNLRTMMASGVVICLWASEDELRQRLTADPSRPLASNWEAVLAARTDTYKALPHHILTTGRTPDSIADEAIALWRTHSP